MTNGGQLDPICCPRPASGTNHVINKMWFVILAETSQFATYLLMRCTCFWIKQFGCLRSTLDKFVVHAWASFKYRRYHHPKVSLERPLPPTPVAPICFTCTCIPREELTTDQISFAIGYRQGAHLRGTPSMFCHSSISIYGRGHGFSQVSLILLVRWLVDYTPMLVKWMKLRFYHI